MHDNEVVRKIGSSLGLDPHELQVEQYPLFGKAMVAMDQVAAETRALVREACVETGWDLFLVTPESLGTTKAAALVSLQQLPNISQDQAQLLVQQGVFGCSDLCALTSRELAGLIGCDSARAEALFDCANNVAATEPLWFEALRAFGPFMRPSDSPGAVARLLGRYEGVDVVNCWGRGRLVMIQARIALLDSLRRIDYFAIMANMRHLTLWGIGPPIVYGATANPLEVRIKATHDREAAGIPSQLETFGVFLARDLKALGRLPAEESDGLQRRWNAVPK